MSNDTDMPDEFDDERFDPADGGDDYESGSPRKRSGSKVLWIVLSVAGGSMFRCCGGVALIYQRFKDTVKMDLGQLGSVLPDSGPIAAEPIAAEKPDAAAVKKHMTRTQLAMGDPMKHMTPDESPTVVALKEGTNVEDDFSGEALEPRWKCYADNGLIVEESDGVAKIHGMAPSSTGRYVNVGFELAHAITAGSFEAQIDVLALSGTFGGGNHRQRHFGFHAIGSNDRRVGLQYWADQYRISHDDGRQYAPSNGDEMNEFHQWRIVYDAVGKTASVFVDDRQIGDTVMVDLGDSFTLKVALSCTKNVHIEGHFDNFRLIGK